ncbi:MAG TPA: hypothetical protein VIH52_03140 [Candidatus Nanoarchaeia archaeon]|nr:hypothetical protein [uncultured archaeon]
MSSLFSVDKGVIPALDIRDLKRAEEIVRETRQVPGIAGYKIGWMLALRYGLGPTVACLKPSHDSLPVIRPPEGWY